MKYIYLIAFLIILFSCKKPPGPGGNASIKGKVTMYFYDASTNTFSKKYPGADVDVYIIYGSETSYGDRIRTDYEGDFEFKYLRKGSYTIYVYSTDTVAFKGPPANPKAPKIAIKKTVTISKNKQTLDAGEFVIADN
ncbi:MAG: hypothetical protein N2203_01035 [Bacteroidia bacterium]|nr:hypothetical protein [Bacteroidia bacterium]